MRALRRWAAALAAAALVCLGGGLAWAATTTGDPALQVSVGGAAFTDRPAGPLFAADNLAPGASTAAVLGVRSRGSAEPLTLRLLPGDSAGALARAVTFTVEVGDTAAGPFRTVWRGSAAGLGAGVGTGALVGSRADRWIRLTAAVPASSGNEVAGAALHFGLRVQLSAVDGSGTGGVSVGGAEGPAGGSGTGGGVQAPGGSGTDGVSIGPISATGVPLALLLAGAGLLGGAGALLLVATCSRSGRTASP
jgi:hypothetical protein